MDLVVVSHCAGDHFGQTLEILANSDITKLLGDHSTLCLAERAGYGGTWDPRMELTTSGATYVQATSPSTRWTPAISLSSTSRTAPT